MRTGRCLAIFPFVAWIMTSPDLSFAGELGECSRVPEDPIEQVELAYGFVEEMNYSCAIKLFKMAAENGNKEGAFNLGVMYANGWGVQPDDKKAVQWFEEAANAGLPEAQYNLGVRYSQGLGVQPDDKKAVQWFEEAANAGLPEAQYNLGVRYFHGRGKIKYDVEAYKWFNLAAAAGSIDASKARDLIISEMTSEQIAEAQKLSEQWLADHSGLHK